MTLDDLERCNSPNCCIISPTSGADYVKVFEDTPILFATEMYTKEYSFWRYIIYGDIGRGLLPAMVIK